VTGPSPTDDSAAGQPPTGEPAPKASRDPRQGLVIARVLGIPIVISPYWFLVAAILVYLYANSLDNAVSPSTTRYLVSAAFVILLYLSVLVHELSHCVVARAFKLSVRRVLLYPLGGFSEIEQEPPTPAQEFAVSAAGPAISLVLAGVAAAVTKVVPDGLPNLLIDQLFRANLLVGLFNLLPGLPLDGGRLLRAGVWAVARNRLVGTRISAWAGRVVAVSIAVSGLVLDNRDWGLTAGLFGVALGAYMWFGAGQSLRAAELIERVPRVDLELLLRPGLLVPSDVSVAEALRRAWTGSARGLVVVDSTDVPRAIVDEARIGAVPPDSRPWTLVDTVARPLEPGLVLDRGLSGEDLLAAVRATPAHEYLVVNTDGSPAGILATADLASALKSPA
jgi:Zn-dependent protease